VDEREQRDVDSALECLQEAIKELEQGKLHDAYVSATAARGFLSDHA
jgi:hypothetical protein